MGRMMFPFITHTCNPLAGGPCPFECSYCWANSMKKQYGWKKYQGDWRTREDQLKQFKEEDFIFAFDMQDIGSPEIPYNVITQLLNWCSNQPSDVLLLTKNPKFYLDYSPFISENVVLGATIETDALITHNYSEAPETYHRLACMEKIARDLPNRTFISIEPIMKMTPNFEREISKINPWGVAVGYDNYNNGLPEPSLERTEILIKELETFTTVYRKTIREARE